MVMGMKKAFKWAAIVFGGLITLGLIVESGKSPEQKAAEDSLTLAYLGAEVFPGKPAVHCKYKEVNSHGLIGCRAESMSGQSAWQLWVWERNKNPEFLALNGPARGVVEGKLSGYGDFGQTVLPLPADLQDITAMLAVFD